MRLHNITTGTPEQRFYPEGRIGVKWGVTYKGLRLHTLQNLEYCYDGAIFYDFDFQGNYSVFRETKLIESRKSSRDIKAN